MKKKKVTLDEVFKKSSIEKVKEKEIPEDVEAFKVNGPCLVITQDGLMARGIKQDGDIMEMLLKATLAKAEDLIATHSAHTGNSDHICTSVEIGNIIKKGIEQLVKDCNSDKGITKKINEYNKKYNGRLHP